MQFGRHGEVGEGLATARAIVSRPTVRAIAPHSPAEKEATADEAAREDWSFDIGLIHEAEAMGLGLTLADALRHTRAQLNAVMERAIKNRALLAFGASGGEKAARDRWTGEFYATLDEIRERLEAERRAATVPAAAQEGPA